MASLSTATRSTGPDDGWYQVQDGDSYASLCEGVLSCVVPDGRYIVINHTTGVRYENVVVDTGEDGTAMLGGRNDAVYVFYRDIDGQWLELQKLTSSSGSSISHSLSLDGDTLLIGAPGSNGSAYQSGAVLVYERSPSGEWVGTRTLLAGVGIHGSVS